MKVMYKIKHKSIYLFVIMLWYWV